MLLVTPRVVRNIERPAVRLEEFNSGTEAEVGGMPIALPGAAVPQPGQPQPQQPQPQQPQQPQPPAPFSGQPPAAGPRPGNP